MKIEYSVVLLILNMFSIIYSSCNYDSIEIDEVEMGIYSVVQYIGKTNTIRRIDTVSLQLFKEKLISQYTKFDNCFIGEVDSVISFNISDGIYWKYMDSIKINVDTLLKGNIEKTFWKVDGPVDWIYCKDSLMINCEGSFDDNYSSYNAVVGKKYLFFMNDELRNSSVCPEKCRGNRGNIIDESDYIWSDFPIGFPQYKISYIDFITLIRTNSNRKQLYKYIRHNNNLKIKSNYDLIGRKKSEYKIAKLMNIKN